MPKKTIEEEKQHQFEMQKRERELRKAGYMYIAGIDEAGRGPLAGTVYAAAVILPPDVCILGLDDSKKLTPKRREALFDEICEKAVAYSIATASETEIDDINILRATHLAMCRAADGLSPHTDYCIIDGNSISGLETAHETMIKGDAKSASVAAASVLAKVSRDRYITEIGKQYPEYGFERHKGYGTKEHVAAILKYGPLPIHRKSFLKKILKEG